MLNDLKGHDYLGSPDFFYRLFIQMLNVKEKDGWTIKDLNYMFANKIIDNNMNFNGCFHYARLFGFLLPTMNESYYLNPIFKDSLSTKDDLQDKILELTLSSLRNTEEFQKIFDPKNILYNVTNNGVEIKNSAFRFKYANFKRLLIDFEFILPLEKMEHYIINKRYKILFDKYILPSIKDKKKLGIDELLKSLEQKRIYGEEAEAFVLKYEQNRLTGHNSLEKIEKISDYHVNAGYDIVSFNTTSSKIIDRFIEVKSFDRTISFYWSRNEKDVAKIKRDEYFLYLVDRSKMNIDGYTPIIIQDPYENVYENHDWNKIVESYHITTQI